MNEDLARSCVQQISIWMSLVEEGKVPHPFFNNRDYFTALLSLRERLELELGNSQEDDDQQGDNFLHLIVAAGVTPAKDSMSDLRMWLRGAEKVIICDPYFFHFKASELYPTAESYSRSLAKLLPSSAKAVDIYSNSFTTSVRKCVMRELKDGRTVRHFSSSGLHDRFIFKNGTEGKIIGTSFGGFGRKFFAMIDLLESDVRTAISELRTLCPRPVGARR